GMLLKLGIEVEQEKDEELINRLLQIMEEDRLDYTNTFIHLTTGEIDSLSKNERLSDWKVKWKHRLETEPRSQNQIRKIMTQHNPAIIPRNYYVEEALKSAAQGDMTDLYALEHVLKNPYDYTEAQEKYRYIPESFKNYR